MIGIVVVGWLRGAGVGLAIVVYAAVALWTIGQATAWAFGDGNWLAGTIAFILAVVFWVCATIGVVVALTEAGFLQ